MMPDPNMIPPMWRAIPPEGWPTHFQNMSYTQLMDIEGCARRWSLQYAQYPSIWDKNNYPERK